jgi:hypothetical protein
MPTFIRAGLHRVRGGDADFGTPWAGRQFSSVRYGGNMAKAQTRKPAAKSTAKPARNSRRSPRKWSAKVTETSDAMDLEKNVFKSESAGQIAASAKRSAERSHRRKSSPFRSAMSMLNFYINRAGKNLSARRKRVLEAAKDRLRRMFHRPAPG